jgi:hypothetical protein
MTPHQIQEALNRPPVFGDVDQIKAIKMLRAQEAENEGKTEYTVTVEISLDETVTVWASDEDEAKEKARDLIDIDDADIYFRVKEKNKGGR